MNIQLNPDIQWSTYYSQYLKDNRVRITNFLSNDSAMQLLDCLKNQVNFNLAFTYNRQPGEISKSDYEALPQQQKEEIIKTVHHDASQGIGFLYGRHLIQPNTESIGLLKELINLMNSNTVLENISQLVKQPGIKLASGQATEYKNGYFLTRHNDIVEKEKRIVAYVLNLTPEWHPDWGGLLQFYEQDGAPLNAWSPVFNSLTLFDVSHVHAVTYVTPYAKERRLSVTGWFRGS